MLEYKNFTFTAAGDGLEQEWPIPHGTMSISIRVAGGDVAMRKATGTAGDHWTVKSGEKESLVVGSMAGESIFFTGDEGATMEIRMRKEGV